MNEILKKHAISEVHQMNIKNDASLHEQLKEIQDWKFPVFVKPARGSGSIGAKKCHSIKEIEDLVSRDDILMHEQETIQDYIVQEFLTGTEYFVDTFSLSGKHQICSVQSYQKLQFKGYPIYRYMEIVDPVGDIWKICSEYVLKVIAAIGLKNGFGHTELILTDSGPALIEVNPRISGGFGFINKLAEGTLNKSQPDLLIDNILSIPYAPITHLINYGRVVCMQNWQAQNLHELNTEMLGQLSSYKDSQMIKQPNTFCDEPKSLLDTVAFVLLVNKDKEKLEQDYVKLIAWEKENKIF